MTREAKLGLMSMENFTDRILAPSLLYKAPLTIFHPLGQMLILCPRD